MKRSDFSKVWDETDKRLRTINQTKGNDYAGNDNAFENFERAARRKRSPRLPNFDAIDAWSIYFFKHLDSLETWLRDRELKSEPIEGRIDDLIVYLHLLQGMIKEANEKPVAKS